MRSTLSNNPLELFERGYGGMHLVIVLDNEGGMTRLIVSPNRLYSYVNNLGSEVKRVYHERIGKMERGKRN